MIPASLWMARARCKDAPLNGFYRDTTIPPMIPEEHKEADKTGRPHRHISPAEHRRREDRTITRYCRLCPVIEDCAAFAWRDPNSVRWGVIAGLTELDRRGILRQMGRRWAMSGFSVRGLDLVKVMELSRQVWQRRGIKARAA